MSVSVLLGRSQQFPPGLEGLDDLGIDGRHAVLAVGQVEMTQGKPGLHDRMAARCAFAGALGSDERSGFVLDRFLQEGVDVTRTVRREDDGAPVNQEALAIMRSIKGMLTVNHTTS